MKRTSTRKSRTSARKRRKTYFFSDAHLGVGSDEEDRARERRIIGFLNTIGRDGNRLFIVGDLFDYWFEYRSVVPKGYVRLLSKLADLTDKGVQISYLAGNHDFWMKNYFRDELGLEIYPEPIESTIEGKRFYIHHGDGLLESDRGYRILRRVLRNRISIFLYSLVHPDLTSLVARWSSHTSRRHTANRSYEEVDMIKFAERKIRAGFDYVIMGHNHAALHRNLGGGVYVNLGDWIREFTYAVFDGKTISLKKWPDSGGK